MSGGEFRRGVVSRSRKLLGMATRVAGHEVAQRVSERVARSAERLGADTVLRRVKQAQIIADHLSELKGAAMKAGQFLSIDASDLLPPEAAEVLRSLQSDAEPVPFETVRQVLAEDLGAASLERLEGLAETPAAAASIGQVHTASVAGRKVAVKVQYPGVAESIPSDLAVLRKVAASFLVASGRRIPLDAIFEELETILTLEADYRHEAESMAAYRKLLVSDGRYRVPEPHLDLSSERVLVMSWLDGVPLGRWIAGSPPLADRQRVAEALLDLYCSEFFDWGLVQTDPNPGNFLITPKGEVGILDFGATMAFEPSFRAEYVELLRCVGDDDDDALLQASIEFGILDARESEEARTRFIEMMRAAAQPFSPEVQPFRFRDPDYQRKAREVVFAFMQAIRFTPPPRRLIFLHRKLGGLFNILKSLDVTLDLEQYWGRMVGSPPPEGWGRAAG
ncbi:MAG: AarF/ABC1/UbiB kinase family protein [Myxococcota bacterium]